MSRAPRPGARPGGTGQLEQHGLTVDTCRTRGQLGELVQALLDVTSGLELDDTLDRVVEAAMRLTGARYGALGVRSAHATQLSQFVHRGIDPSAVANIGGLPRGRGVLGLMFDEPVPLRLDDLGQHPSSVGLPPGHPTMRTFLGVPVRVRGGVFGILYLSEKASGATFTEDDEIIVQALTSAAGVAIDNARIHDQAQARRSRLEALQDVSTELLGGNDPGRAIQLVADRACELTDADQSFVAVPSDPDVPPDQVDELVITVASGPESGHALGRRIPVNRSSSGEVFRTRLPNSSDHLEYDAFGSAVKDFGPAMITPLRAVGTATGVLVALRRRGRPTFDTDQLALMTSFADQAALALRVAAAQREKQELTLLADRDRIARDLHDHVIQRLFAAGLSLHGTLRRTEAPEVRARIDSTIDELQAIIGDIRTVIFDLHSGASESENLGRLRRAVADLTADSGLVADVRFHGPLGAVRPDLADHAEAVVREAVSNAVRHSSADTVAVMVTVDDQLTVEVEDDGSGVDTPSAPSGLANLAARAREVDGTFEFDSTVGSGTRVRWSAPLPERRAAEAQD
ncbi:GAF domain-containing protein [Rhodococcus sp. ABRD24]|uniref:GAF domain-containing sensor histidine kinase n=1 Tax=Rhodococcus sp. ABRD24 TaxID=2507582 RepID=UPI0013F1592F|nr:GAF domain-containing protein [Rhodococcus sp. ABRD24]